MSEFVVKYWRKGKPTGARPFIALNSTFEKVLFEMTLGDICESSYHTHYEWFYLNEIIFIKRTIANGPLCEYEVTLFDWYDKSKLQAEFIVEIECIINDNSVDVFEQNEELQVAPTIVRKPIKEKEHTKWFLAEERATRSFLLSVYSFGGLKEVKRLMSKATYHRNLKVCREKGYIVGDKVVKRIFISKTQ